MTTFDRKAYLDQVSDLLVKAAATARRTGMANCGQYDGEPGKRAAIYAEHDEAFSAALDAIYALPHELDGAELRERAA
jgi:hypothetical protein